jgi:hypothetical protein
VSPDVIRPVDRLVVVAERLTAYAAELRALVEQVKAETQEEPDGG